MSDKFLISKTEMENDKLFILSPTIGRVILNVAKGQAVMPGQNIGTLIRLDQRFTLKLPNDVTGTIATVTSRDRVMPLEYGQRIFELEQTVLETAAHKREESQTSDNKNSVHAPMDGMFYLSASPKDPPYVKVGDIIAPGQTIGLIEVMKCFYPLKYHGQVSAKIVDIKVDSASPVSSGATLMIISEN